MFFFDENPRKSQVNSDFKLEKSGKKENYVISGIIVFLFSGLFQFKFTRLFPRKSGGVLQRYEQYRR